MVGKRGKATGKRYNFFNLHPVDKSIEPYNVDLERSEYHRMQDENQQQVLVAMHGLQQEVHMQIIPFYLHGNQECMAAKKEEIDKIVKKFKAVKVVKDVGQFRISSRFVLWYKKHSNGEIQTRARLVARGYEEQQEVPSDSPTMDQTNLKLILAIAQAQRWKVHSVDVKAAFLQGLPLKERTVTMIPPPEAGVPAGHLWELRVALYGLFDASLRFHWKVKEVMEELGMKQSRYDPALFFKHDEQCNLIGIWDDRYSCL